MSVNPKSLACFFRVLNDTPLLKIPIANCSVLGTSTSGLTDNPMMLSVVGLVSANPCRSNPSSNNILARARPNVPVPNIQTGL